MTSIRTTQILKSSIQITMLSFISTIFGFLTQIILASRYGTSADMDAYLVSITIPYMVVSIFVGSLNYTFVPVFVDNKQKGQNENALKAANNLFNICIIVFGTISVLGMIYSENIIIIIAPGLESETKHIATTLSMIQMPVILISALSALLSSIYYSEKSFFLPAMATLSNSVITFFSVFLFANNYGIKTIAIGSMVGSCTTFIILLPNMLRKYHYKMIIDFSDNETIRILKLMVPLLIGALFYRADNLIQRYIASNLTVGSISIIGYSTKLITTTSTLIVSGVSVVLLSHVSELTSNNDSRGVGDTFLSIFKWLTFIYIPAIIIIIVLGKDIIQLLFQRGQFNSQSTYYTWICMMLYGGVFYGGIIGAIVTPIFYAYKDTKTVVKIGILGAILQMYLSYLLTKQLNFFGLPIAYSISNLVTIFIFILLLNKKYINIKFKDMTKMATSVAIVGILISFLLWEIKYFYLKDINIILRIFIVGFIGLIMYMGLTFYIKIDEAQRLLLYINNTVLGMINTFHNRKNNINIKS